MSRFGLPQELVRSNSGTLHAQLYETLRAQIRSGEFGPGTKLPTEAQLIDLYRVSRATARRAVDDLRRDGLVERKPALGTFVREQPLAAKISGIHSLTDEILILGKTPGSRILNQAIVAAEAEIADQLEIKPGSEVLRLDRVRTADDRPFFVAESFINIQAFPALASQNFASPTLSLLKTYRSVLGQEVERMTQLVSAVGASKTVAEVFNIDLGAPVLCFERSVYLRGGRPAEHVKAYFRGGSYKYFSELS